MALKTPHTYDYAEYEAARHKAELTNEQIAHLLGVSVRTYDRWKARWRTDGHVSVRRSDADVLERALGLSRLHLDGHSGPSAVVDGGFRFEPDRQEVLAEQVALLLDGQQKLWDAVDALESERDALHKRVETLEAAQTPPRSSAKRRTP